MPLFDLVYGHFREKANGIEILQIKLLEADSVDAYQTWTQVSCCKMESYNAGDWFMVSLYQLAYFLIYLSH